MSYQAAIDQLSAMTPELFTQPGHTRRKFSLDEVAVLLDALGNPHRTFPSVLIAGTNGKGSTAATLASILRASGLRTGLYTSPHLTRPNERIAVNGVDIPDDAFAQAYQRVNAAAERLVTQGNLARMPSFFETVTAMAFLHFAAASLDIAVLEVGMGGRLDATNVVDPLLSIVTDISLDHTEWLGPTIAAIAAEKAGILRPNGTLVTLPQHPQANQVLGEKAIELGARAVSAVPCMPPTSTCPAAPYAIEVLGQSIQVASPLRGAHQHRNVALAAAAAVELALHHRFPITPDSIAAGVRETRWPARFESISQDGVDWILDVAHNPAGAWALRAGLRSLDQGERDRTLIFSCLRDKPLDEMAQILFPFFNQVIFAPIQSARATPMADLLAAAQATGTIATAAASIADAIEMAAQHAALSAGPRAPIIVVSGSVYLVGAARPLLLARAGGIS